MGKMKNKVKTNANIIDKFGLFERKLAISKFQLDNFKFIPKKYLLENHLTELNV